MMANQDSKEGVLTLESRILTINLPFQEKKGPLNSLVKSF